MKPIELSDLQREHILEMCNRLFPEYKRKNINSWEFGEDDYGMIEFLMYEDNKKLKAIHWFEFCITILMNKIYYEFYKDMRGNWELLTAETFLIKVIKYDIYPIDYLYEQFKKIK